jgi:membrane-bound serine protease (ClpP class)
MRVPKMLGLGDSRFFVRSRPRQGRGVRARPRVAGCALISAVALLLLPGAASRAAAIGVPSHRAEAGLTSRMAPVAGGAQGAVLVLPVAAAIGPVTARFLGNGIAQAERDSARAVVIELDTPGGLDASMRQIVKAILASRVPVVVYVSPPGARAASAGMFITMAAPVAAMAPGTSIGAATPVSIGGEVPVIGDTLNVMRAKVVNDAASYARSLAQRYGRNAAWAERAVREAASLSAEEARRDSVVDLVSPTLEALLAEIDGRVVRLERGEAVLHTAGAPVLIVTLSRRERILAFLSDPSVAYLLFLVGILGLALELYHPGVILPGVAGAISLILAFFAFQGLPVHAAGILLILLGLVLFVLEVKVTSYGILTIGGVTSLTLGSLFLFGRDPAYRVSLAVVLPAILVFAAVVLAVVWLAARAQRRPRQGGLDGMVGEIGEAVTALDPEGRIDIRGEYWNAVASVPIPRGGRVHVVRARGLQLEVEPVPPGRE